MIETKCMKLGIDLDLDEKVWTVEAAVTRVSSAGHTEKGHGRECEKKEGGLKQMIGGRKILQIRTITAIQDKEKIIQTDTLFRYGCALFLLFVIMMWKM